MGGWTLVPWAVILGDVQRLQEPKGPTNGLLPSLGGY